jgi:hypothetical protein
MERLQVKKQKNRNGHLLKNRAIENQNRFTAAYHDSRMATGGLNDLRIGAPGDRGFYASGFSS